MNTDGEWKVVTARGRHQSNRSLSPVSMIKHRFVVRKGDAPKGVFVNAPAHVAKGDVAHAVHNPHSWAYPECFFQPNWYLWVRNIKYIPELEEFEFISDTNSFQH